jgi:aminoglycoside phosphotransferase (APT) family kinase protein
LNDADILRVDEEKGITSDQYKRLRELSKPLAEWCGELEAGGIPCSLHHGDLNSSNVLNTDDQYAFVDWGDASLAHPFSSLRTALVSVEMALDLPDYDPSTAPLRDAYLSTCSEYETPERIRATFCLAQRQSSIVSALSWYRGIRAMSPLERSEYHHIVPLLLQEFLDADLNAYPFV